MDVAVHLNCIITRLLFTRDRQVVFSVRPRVLHFIYIQHRTSLQVNLTKRWLQWSRDKQASQHWEEMEKKECLLCLIVSYSKKGLSQSTNTSISWHAHVSPTKNALVLGRHDTEMMTAWHQHNLVKNAFRFHSNFSISTLFPSNWLKMEWKRKGTNENGNVSRFLAWTVGDINAIKTIANLRQPSFDKNLAWRFINSSWACHTFL